MSIRHLATATALLVLVAASPAFAQSQSAEQPQANTITDEYGKPIADEYGNKIQRDPEMLQPEAVDKKKVGKN